MNLVPSFRYADAPAAIAWLCEAFGFTEQLVVPLPDGSIAHAQLRYGDGIFMLGSYRDDDDFSKLVAPPAVVGGGTGAVYVVVADADAHFARAQAHGATIVMPLTDQEYGGRDYTCQDCEGHVWSFGTYDPWASPA